jgi:hypothetical protein
VVVTIGQSRQAAFSTSIRDRDDASVDQLREENARITRLTHG